MATQVKITKVDGTVHFAPIGTIRNHIRLNNLLAKHQMSRIEEVSEDGKKVIKVHEEGSGAKELAGQAEIARLKFENEKLQRQLAEKKGSGQAAATGSAEELIAKIKAAGTENEVDDIIGNDERHTVLKAAKEKKAELSGK